MDFNFQNCIFSLKLVLQNFDYSEPEPGAGAGIAGTGRHTVYCLQRKKEIGKYFTVQSTEQQEVVFEQNVRREKE